MSKKARSARGDVVDFDLLAIRQQLATVPIPVGVDQRRKFIDEKDGIKTKAAAPSAKSQAPSVPSALMMAAEAAATSAQAAVAQPTSAKKAKHS